MYKTGLVSISFRSLSVEELVNKVKDAGLEYIEWGSDVHAPKDDIKKLEMIAKLQEETGIKCSSYGTYFRFMKDDPEELRGYIKAAKILGTDILRLWCGTKGSKDMTDEDLENLYKDAEKAAKIAEENGVKLCMECHNDTLTDWKEPALALMQRVNSPAFRMYWQPNQHRTLEENIAYAKMLAPYTEHLHVFNWAGDKRFPLIDGVETWKTYLKEFSDDKYLLLEFMPDDKIETLPTEANALREIIK
ncbi:MAG: sugar phosphate isomerase/epimerase [Ruminococcaceae bacterium]|nr:sugar phosphate isomerase/epimerase [Oscillospiraceae bacterium]